MAHYHFTISHFNLLLFQIFIKASEVQLFEL